MNTQAVHFGHNHQQPVQTPGMSPQTTSSEPEPPQPGHLVRIATSVMRVKPIIIWGRLIAWGSRAKRQANTNQKDSPQSKPSPTYTGKIIEAGSWALYLTELKGQKEVLMAFYENEKVPPLLLRGIYTNSHPEPRVGKDAPGVKAVGALDL